MPLSSRPRAVRLCLCILGIKGKMGMVDSWRCMRCGMEGWYFGVFFAYASLRFGELDYTNIGCVRSCVTD
jgi:hypothetical protein